MKKNVKVIGTSVATLASLGMLLQPTLCHAASMTSDLRTQSINLNNAQISAEESTSGVFLNWSSDDWACLSKMTSKERRVYLNYMHKEPEVSDFIKEMIEAKGGELTGFANRIKSPHSLYEKIHLRPDSNYNIDNAYDILRYTALVSEDKYTECADETLMAFINNGYSINSFRNAWANEEVPYQGLNVSLVSPEGLILEIQFHTAKSFEVKNSEEDHALYERRRMLTEGTPEYEEILNEQFELYSGVEIPEGLKDMTIENYKSTDKEAM